MGIKRNMKKYLGLFIVLIMALVVKVNVIKAEDSVKLNVGAEGKVCTMEAKQCDDGSFVSRTGPDCEFAECPDSKDAEKSKSSPLIRLKENNDGEIKIEIKGKTKNQIEESQKSLEVKIEAKQKENENAREQAKQKMEDLKAEIKNEKDQVKAKEKEDRITGRENALEKFDNAVERISELKDRVNAAIVALEAKGVVTTDAKTFALTADTKLTNAKIKIVEAHALLVVSINELTPENKASLITLAQDIQTLIKDAHLALNNAVKSLKDAVKLKIEADLKASANTTSTNTTSTTTETNQ